MREFKPKVGGNLVKVDYDYGLGLGRAVAYQYEAQKLRAQVCSLMIPELRDVRAGYSQFP